MMKSIQAIAACLMLAGAGTALAQTDPVDAPFGAGSRIGAPDLSRITGQADVAMEVRAENTATVSHNSVSGNSQTGTINFDANAFQALSGLSLLSANTGNNVSINSSLNVNVSIQPQ